MAGCCDPSGYPAAFSRAGAERSVRAFRRRGLDSTARPMIDALTDRGLAGMTVTEIGAGAGTASVAMLEAGASSVLGVDLSPNTVPVAERLLRDSGFAGRFEWHTGDYVALASRLPAADVVFLNRVVCCYPDMQALVDTAAAGSRRHLAMSFPRRRLVVRLVVAMLNGWLRINRSTFRVFVHHPDAIAARVRSAGFERVGEGRTPGWTWAIWRRVEGGVA